MEARDRGEVSRDLEASHSSADTLKQTKAHVTPVPHVSQEEFWYQSFSTISYLVEAFE